MHPLLAREIQADADLIERFVTSYRKRFAAAIDELNHRAGHDEKLPPDLQCLRLCVETMDMLLMNQGRLARSVSQLTGGSSMMKAA